jgi:hypothetical protein
MSEKLSPQTEHNRTARWRFGVTVAGLKMLAEAVAGDGTVGRANTRRNKLCQQGYVTGARMFEPSRITDAGREIVRQREMGW